MGDVPAATAILDRFLHHAEIITITGRSYRLKDKATKNEDVSKESMDDEQGKKSKIVAQVQSDRPGPLGLRRPGLLPPGIGHVNRHEFTCKTAAENVRNEQMHWLVLTRSVVAGFNPIRDTKQIP